ncbi:MAG TPA: hypothetical protein VIJ00_01230 [Nakamurella sp.]
MSLDGLLSVGLSLGGLSLGGLSLDGLSLDRLSLDRGQHAGDGAVADRPLQRGHSGC